MNGVSRRSATGWFLDGVLAVRACQLAAGTILVDVPGQTAAGVAICARVSCVDQRSDLDRQVARLAEYLTARGVALSEVVFEVGSGRSGRRTRLLALLRDASVGTIVVGHRERVARFGVEYLEAALAARGRKLIVAGQAEVGDDLVRDMVEVLTSFCARLCGRRSARRRAVLALAAACSAEVA
jgi:putative resolvase